MKNKKLDDTTFSLTSAEKQKLLESVEKARKVPAPENSLGQWIGYVVDDGTGTILNEIIEEIGKQLMLAGKEKVWIKSFFLFADIVKITQYGTKE